MTMQIVNGVLCLNCTDVERAKKAALNGPADAQDPLQPSTTIANNGANGVSSPNDATSGTPGTPGVTPGDAPAFGVNQPLASGDRGTQLNLLT